MATKWQPNDNQMTTQYRIGKYRIGKDRIGKDSSSTEQFETDTADELEKFQPHSNFLPTEIEIEIEIEIDIESEVDIGKPATENGSYTECIQNVYSLDTQISIDKSRLDKSSISSSIEQFETDTATEKNIFDYRYLRSR